MGEPREEIREEFNLIWRGIWIAGPCWEPSEMLSPFLDLEEPDSFLYT